MNIPVEFIQQADTYGTGNPKVNSLGIWTLGDRLGIGFVVLLETPAREILLIRKAPKDGYEYSGQFALPGGMVRSTQESRDGFSEALRHSIDDRLKAEVGISLGSLSLLALHRCNPVTSYTAKGARRHTLVLPFTGNVAGQLPIATQSSSVEDPQWRHWEEIISLIGEVAPANRLILAAFFQNRLSSKQHAAIAVKINEARNLCTAWAGEAGWPFNYC